MQKLENYSAKIARGTGKRKPKIAAIEIFETGVNPIIFAHPEAPAQPRIAMQKLENCNAKIRPRIFASAPTDFCKRSLAHGRIIAMQKFKICNAKTGKLYCKISKRNFSEIKALQSRAPSKAATGRAPWRHNDRKPWRPRKHQDFLSSLRFYRFFKDQLIAWGATRKRNPS